MFNKIKSNKCTPYIMIILLGVFICIPLFTWAELKGEYGLHLLRIEGVKECIKDGVFPPLISYKHMNGFGYGLNIFYGIFTTYIPMLISYLTNSITQAIKIFVLLCSIFSGITMYNFAHTLTKSKRIGLISALIYMTAPYILTDLYERSALGEYSAFVFIPLVFNGLYHLINKDRKGNLLLIVGASLLIFTHTITTIYTALFGVIFILFNFKKVKNTFFWKNILLDIIMILLITAVYTIPLMEHKFATEYAIFNAEDMRSTKYDVYKNTNSPIEWFNLIPKPEGTMDFSFGIPIIFLVLTSAITFKKVDKKYKDTYTTMFVLGIISLVMCTKVFPWLVMPHFLTIIQFAWRIQGFFALFISIVCGINAYVLTSELSKHKDRNLCIIIALIFICSGINVSNRIEFDSKKTKLYEERLKEIRKLGVYNINRDYMPKKGYDNREFINKREDKTYVISGSAEVKNETKDKLYDKMEIQVSENAELELPYLYYLGYDILLNGEKLDYYESNNGMICIKTDKSGELEIKYNGTIIEKLGYVISVGGIIILLMDKFYLKKIN